MNDLLRQHTDDVLNDPRLDIQRKRARLASWASDTNAVPDAPCLRRLPDGSIVKVTDLLKALCALDDRDGDRATRGKKRHPSPQPDKRRQAAMRDWLRQRFNRSNDDDDPPPCPAHAATPPRRNGGGALALLETAAA